MPKSDKQKSSLIIPKCLKMHERLLNYLMVILKLHLRLNMHHFMEMNAPQFFLGFKISECSCVKIFTPKQMLQRLPIALAHVKAGNTSENLLNKIHQIIYSLYQPKEII